jgi:hypothetical protein
MTQNMKVQLGAVLYRFIHQIRKIKFILLSFTIGSMILIMSATAQASIFNDIIDNAGDKIVDIFSSAKKSRRIHSMTLTFPTGTFKAIPILIYITLLI